MHGPQASVVIPSYNHGRFLDACLESALSSRVDLEVVVVDDGSTDDSRQRLASRTGDPRLRIYHQANQGAHAALNRGLELARGKILFLLNSDDLFEPERLEVFLERFEKEPGFGILSSWLTIIGEDDSELGVKQAWHNLPPWPRPGPGPGLADTGDPPLALLEANYVATTSNVAFRRELFHRHGLRFLPLRYTHDWDFLLAACERGFEVIKKPLVRYRVHAENTLGEGRETRQGQMRFEILWTVARHASRLLRKTGPSALTLPFDALELQRRAWASLPRFGHDDLLLQLLCLRGEGADVPSAYDDLLDAEHPFRRAAEIALAASP